MRSTQKRGTYIKFLIYLVIVVLVNAAGITLFFRLDLTGNNIYSLSEASKKVVSTLSEPLTIHVFFTRNLPAPHNHTERYLRDLLEAYAVNANRFFNFRFFDVNEESEAGGTKGADNRKLAETYGIPPVQIQVVEKDEIKFKKAYMGLVMIHGDIVEQIPAVTSTSDLEYRLTTSIQKLNNKISALLNLKDKIRIMLFLSSSLSPVAPHMGIKTLADYPKEVEAMVNRLSGKLYKKLDYAKFDPSTDPNAESMLQKYNVMRLRWPAFSDGKIEEGSGAIGLVLEYKESFFELPLLNVMRIPIIGTRYELVDVKRLEEALNAGIERLININADLGYLADHGTPSAMDFSFGPRQQDEDGLSNFAKLASQNYSIKHIPLKEKGLPEALGCLVIAGPREPFNEYELFQIDQALMRGTNLAIFLDALSEPPGGQMQGFGQGAGLLPLDTGLEKLLNHWGVDIKKSVVMDENCFKQQLGRQFGGGERPIYFAPIIKNERINHDLSFAKNIKGLITLQVSPVTLIESRIAENKIKANLIFSSSEKSWEMKERINLNPMFIQPPASDKEKQSIPLAYLLEGEFPSYFAGKPIPEKPSGSTENTKGTDKSPAAGSPDAKPKAEKPKSDLDLSKIEPKGAFIAKGRQAKVFIIGSSEVLKDNIIDPDGKTENALFTQNLLDYLNNREEISVLRGKEARFNPLKEMDPFIKNFVKAFNIVGIPVMVVMFGLGVYAYRRSRRRKIQDMFRVCE